MSALASYWAHSDGVSRAAMLVLLAMSLLTWTLLLAKCWQMARARRGLTLGIAGFWQAANAAEGLARLKALAPASAALALGEAALHRPTAGTLQASAALSEQRTRQLRDALVRSMRRLRAGLAALASIGATAPFVGLLGTVWAVQQALLGLSGPGAALTIEQIAGPVGDALIMTAAGLAVAIPAVLAYNALNHWAGLIEADLEGFAHDLLSLP